MKKYFLIYNPKCSKSIEAVRILKENSILFTKVNYLEGELTREFLKKIKESLKLSFLEMIRQKEAVATEFLNNKTHSEDEWIDFILKNPIVLERPIFIADDKAIIARPPELLIGLI